MGIVRARDDSCNKAMTREQIAEAQALARD